MKSPAPCWLFVTRCGPHAKTYLPQLVERDRPAWNGSNVSTTSIVCAWNWGKKIWRIVGQPASLSDLWMISRLNSCKNPDSKSFLFIKHSRGRLQVIPSGVDLLWSHHFSELSRDVSRNVGIPKNGWSIVEHIFWHGWFGGYPYVKKPPYGESKIPTRTDRLGRHHSWSVAKMKFNHCLLVYKPSVSMFQSLVTSCKCSYIREILHWLIGMPGYLSEEPTRGGPKLGIWIWRSYPGLLYLEMGWSFPMVKCVGDVWFGSILRESYISRVYTLW